MTDASGVDGAPPILEVVWRDATRSTGWTDRSKAVNSQLLVVHSTGFLLDRSPIRWVLAGAYVEGDRSVIGIEQIPTPCILSAKCLTNCEAFVDTIEQGVRTP